MSVCCARATVLLSLTTAACFAEPGAAGTADGTGSTSTAAQTTTSETAEPTTADTTTDAEETDEVDTSSTGEVCRPMSLNAAGEFSRTDIAFIVDTSPSMLDNAASVQQMMDTLSSLAATADDLRIVVIADIGEGPCLPKPLGIPDCTNNSNPAAGYQRIDAPTSDPDADLLQELITTLSGDAITIFRGDAQKHLVVMTDRDLNEPPMLTQQIAGLGPRYLYTRLHAVAGGNEAGTCTPPSVLNDIVDTWNGESLTMCPLDGSGLFDAVGRNPSCIFTVPDLPDGVDDAQISEVTLVTAREELALEQLRTPNDCLLRADGVLLQGSRALLCPSTCALYQDLSEDPGALRFTFATCEPDE